MERKFGRGKIVACIPFSFFILFDVRYLEISLDTFALFIYFFFSFHLIQRILVSLRVGYDIYVYRVYTVSIC